MCKLKFTLTSRSFSKLNFNRDYTAKTRFSVYVYKARMRFEMSKIIKFVNIFRWEPVEYIHLPM